MTTVTTASAGNHGLALATAAARLGLNARVHIPKTAPAAKRDAMLRVGAQIVQAETYDDAERQAQEDVAQGGVEFVSAYSHSDVIAGAGTIALEIVDDTPDLDLLIVPVGGGGLISGMAIAAQAVAQRIEIRGAEAAASPVFTAALAAGQPVTVEVDPTLADGLAGNMEHDSQTFAIVHDLVSRVDVVPEATIARAMRELIARERLIVEGASAVAVGALLAAPHELAGRRVGVVLTGRNVDPGTIRQVFCE
jgi:threonine dehydratase